MLPEEFQDEIKIEVDFEVFFLDLVLNKVGLYLEVDQYVSGVESAANPIVLRLIKLEHKVGFF